MPLKVLKNSRKGLVRKGLPCESPVTAQRRVLSASINVRARSRPYVAVVAPPKGSRGAHVYASTYVSSWKISTPVTFSSSWNISSLLGRSEVRINKSQWNRKRSCDDTYFELIVKGSCQLLFCFYVFNSFTCKLQIEQLLRDTFRVLHHNLLWDVKLHIYLINRNI